MAHGSSTRIPGAGSLAFLACNPIFPNAVIQNSIPLPTHDFLKFGNQPPCASDIPASTAPLAVPPPVHSGLLLTPMTGSGIRYRQILPVWAQFWSIMSDMDCCFSGSPQIWFPLPLTRSARIPGGNISGMSSRDLVNLYDNTGSGYPCTRISSSCLTPPILMFSRGASMN